jgi:CMP/dCMP kinase
MTLAKIIAIDGTAGSGKSTLGQKLAERLGYLYFDSGVMYRAVTLAAIESEIFVSDEAAVTRLAEDISIDVKPASIQDGRSYDVIVDGQDATWDIRRPEVDANVSIVSAYPGVRKALTAAQRKIGMRGRVVMVGRDIGTVVLPEADLKIFLDASLEERARRRSLELNLRGEPALLGDVMESMIARDKIDSTREIAPLRAAEDAVIINSDELDARQVLEKALGLAYKS